MTFVEPFIRTIIRHFKITLFIIAGFTLFFSWQYLQQTHNNHIEIFFADDDPLFTAYEKFQETYGNEEYGIIALESTSLFSNAGFSSIATLTEALEKIDGIDRVLSLSNMEEFYGEDDTIHFVSWLRRNSGIHNDPEAAIVQTFLDVGKPIVITTFLLFSGFMVLMLGSIIPTRMFGMLTAFSMVFALIGDFFVLPPLVLILKPKLPPLDRQNNAANMGSKNDDFLVT